MQGLSVYSVQQLFRFLCDESNDCRRAIVHPLIKFHDGVFIVKYPQRLKVFQEFVGFYEVVRVSWTKTAGFPVFEMVYRELLKDKHTTRLERLNNLWKD